MALRLKARSRRADLTVMSMLHRTRVKEATEQSEAAVHDESPFEVFLLTGPRSPDFRPVVYDQDAPEA
jgi:hypothetical protein